MRVYRRRTLATSRWKCSTVHSSGSSSPVGRSMPERAWLSVVGCRMSTPAEASSRYRSGHGLMMLALLDEHFGDEQVPMGGGRVSRPAPPLVQRRAGRALVGAGLVKVAQLSTADAQELNVTGGPGWAGESVRPRLEWAVSRSVGPAVRRALPDVGGLKWSCPVLKAWVACSSGAEERIHVGSARSSVSAVGFERRGGGLAFGRDHGWPDRVAAGQCKRLVVRCRFGRLLVRRGGRGRLAGVGCRRRSGDRLGRRQ